MDYFKFSQCPTCGGHKLIKQGDKFVCSHCENFYYDVKANQEFYSSLDMALTQRQVAKFDDAFEIYNTIVNKYHDYDLSDAYFGMFLCEFNVIFESDLSGEPFPSFYGMRKTSCYSNYYYKKAVEYANKYDSKKVKIFEQLIEKVDYARKTFMAIEKNNRPYDIFICYKKTDKNGDFTQEFEKAKHLYKYLKSLGFKVFFADETINSQPVREWEPNIYHALYTAKAMIVMCSNNDYLTSPWVQNEWKRFISIKSNDLNRAPVIPVCCGGFKTSELPNTLAKYQALQYSSDIENNIKDALFALTRKVNDEKEFLFKYKKPLNKKIIAAIVAGCSAVVVAAVSVITFFNVPRIKYKKFDNAYSVVGSYGKCKNIIIPAHYKGLPVNKVGDSAFENNESILNVSIGNKVTYIGNRSFAGMKNLKDVVMSNTISSIGDYAFYDCDNLITMKFSSGMTKIPTGLMGSCEKLFSVTIPKSILSIDVAAFFNCSSLSVINYSGTKSEWENVSKGQNNGSLLDAYVVYNYDVSEDSGDESVAPLIFIIPTTAYTIGKGYSETELQYNSTLKQWEIHKGIDFLTIDSSPVYAVQDGIVNSIETNYLNGTFFSITHSQGFVSFYYSVQNVQVVEGQHVSRGETIAYTGYSNNEQNEGLHLHFELLHNGVKVNPADYINL